MIEPKTLSLSTNLLPGTIFHHRQFQHSVGLKSFSAELSDLALAGRPLFAPIYRDAVDVGLTLIGAMHEATFYLEDAQVDRDGDLMLYRFAPTRETLRLLPQLQGYLVVVYND